MEALQDPDIQVRMAAAQSLADFKREASLAVLTGALRNPQKPIREEAISILSSFASRGIDLDAAVDDLIKAIHDSVPLVSWTAVETLGRIGSEAAVNPLIDILKGRDSFLRERAVLSLGYIKSEDAVNPIISTLKDSDIQFRFNAVVALGLIKSESAIAAIMEAVNDPDENVSWQAFQEIVEMEAQGRKSSVHEKDSF